MLSAGSFAWLVAANVVCVGLFVFWTLRALHDRRVAARSAELELREREEDLAITVQSIGDAVIATDAKGRVTRMNPVAERLTGWSLGNAKGRELREVFRVLSEGERAPAESLVERVLREGAVVAST